MDEIVREAHVTKGALYHHFGSKRGLFSAVFYQVEAQWTTRIAADINEHVDPAERAAAGLRSFLQMCREETYRQIIVQDGPSVLGAEIHDPERRSAYAIVAALAQQVTEPLWSDDEAKLRTLSRILYAVMTSAGATIAFSPDPDGEVERAEEAITLLLLSMRHTVTTHPGLEETIASRPWPWITRRRWFPSPRGAAPPRYGRRGP